MPQKGLFNGLEGQNNLFSAEFFFHHLGLFFATSDAKVGMSDPTPLTPRATKRPFQWSRRPKRLIVSGKKVFHCEHFFPLRNQWDRYFFTLVNVFCHMLFFDFIGLGSYKNAACGLETRVKIFCYIQALV